MPTQNEYFERSSKVVNGFFYTYDYYQSNPKALYDKNPFIFCIGPIEKRENLFAGINLHHIPIDDRAKLIELMQTQYRILDDDTQHLISEESLNRLVPGVLFGWRVYNSNNIYNLKRVKNDAVPLFLHEQGDIYLGTPDAKYVKYMLQSGIYKSSKYVQ